MSDTEENIERSEVVRTTKSRLGLPLSMFREKMARTSVIHHTFTFKNPRNINNDNFQAIIAQSSNESTTLVLEPNPQYELSKGNGIFLIRKIPAGTVLNIEEMNAINKGSKKIGLTLKSIGINYETDGVESSSINSTIKELSHDIIIITIKGAKKLLGKQMLTLNINYLEIDRALERKIYNKRLKKDYEDIEEPEILSKSGEPSLVHKIFKMFTLY